MSETHSVDFDASRNVDDAEFAARHEVEDLWWLRDSLASLLGDKPDGDVIRVGILRNLLKTTEPATTTTHPRVTPPGAGA